MLKIISSPPPRAYCGVDRISFLMLGVILMFVGIALGYRG
jgi:hypothetical protein